METGPWIIERLAAWGRPDRSRSFAAAFSPAFDVTVLLVPVAAVALRLAGAEPPAAWRNLLLLAAGAFALAALIGAVAASRRAGDALRAARGVDRTYGLGDLLLTAVDSVRRGVTTRLSPLLLRDATRALKEHAPSGVVVPTWRLPAPGRVLLSLLLALVILLIPRLSGGFGPERIVDDANAAATEGVTPGDRPADGLGASREFAGKVRVTASTDSTVYGLGQEIKLTIRLETLEPLPEGIALGAVVRADGEKFITLPLDWTLPVEPGKILEAEFPMKDRLKAVDCYRRGLLALDPVVHPRVDHPDLRGTAPGNRVVIQISENEKRIRSKTPTPVEKKKQNKRRPEKDEKKKNKPEDKPKQPKKKPKGGGPPPPAPEPPPEIDAKPFVVEPLFSGDEEIERDVRLFEREKVNSNRPPEPPAGPDPKSRAYERAEEALLEKLRLPGRERRLVRRYLDGLRPVKER